jgi:hypothetical protein
VVRKGRLQSQIERVSSQTPGVSSVERALKSSYLVEVVRSLLIYIVVEPV